MVSHHTRETKKREGQEKPKGQNLRLHGKRINWEMCDGDMLPLEILSRRVM